MGEESALVLRSADNLMTVRLQAVEARVNTTARMEDRALIWRA